MWSLLLKSELAAALLIWGFLVIWLLLVWSFIKRYTNNFVAIMTILTFVAAPVFITFSTAIKSDFPVSVFLFAHWCVLAKIFNNRLEKPEDIRKWTLLAGILCGCAIGHKLIGLPAALASSLIFILSDLHYRRKYGSPYISQYWISALILTTLPP